MIFFGWGSKNKSAPLDAGRALVLRYSYFHLFWILRVSWGLRYSLATATESGWAMRPLSDEEAMQLDAPSRLSLNVWWRWGLVIWAALAVVGIVLAQLGALLG
ncbi:hypothetical protein ACFQBY_09320 [Promicromonospora citrea]|uniref:Uncharacterized protein n=1 Tax=Promicromonospora citrea TaxID=43677 RepID=A0A8H9GCU9_9MICO|nr:hypothetical protein [Promicromonospora citrea]NNH53704.1 hypothetical protein [Promicromonospora citrea]GGM10345.1 hypothetical protein GCM10010102_02730 [Promicromonospora citrea]HEV6955392.1 hypothetical protein [Promicromonospora sp.]